ncbi:MAG: class I tRNA ligase family protein, partial [Rhodanobacter sp.]
MIETSQLHTETIKLGGEGKAHTLEVKVAPQSVTAIKLHFVHAPKKTASKKIPGATAHTFSKNDEALLDQLQADAFRYFLIREMNVGQDSDFTREQFLVRYNSELANNLGNLVNRTLNMT